MIKNKNGGKRELLAEDKRKMQRLAGLLKESMFFEEAPEEEEEPLPDDSGAPDMGGEPSGGDMPPMDDMGGDDLGMDDEADVPAGPEGVSNPLIGQLMELITPAIEEAIGKALENGELSIESDDTEVVPSAELPGSEGDPSMNVPSPEGGEGMEMTDEPEDPSLQKEAVPIPSARRQDPLQQKYNQLEEDLFESVMRRVRKEMLNKPATKPVTSKKK